MKEFEVITENTEETFSAHLNEFVYIEIHKSGWIRKGLNKYLVSIWITEIGKVLDEHKKFKTIEDAKTWALKESENWI